MTTTPKHELGSANRHYPPAAARTGMKPANGISFRKANAREVKAYEKAFNR